MALKKVRGNLERMFDKNLTDLVRGIRNHKDNEVNVWIDRLGIYCTHIIDQLVLGVFHWSQTVWMYLLMVDFQLLLSLDILWCKKFYCAAYDYEPYLLEVCLFNRETFFPFYISVQVHSTMHWRDQTRVEAR